MTNTIPMQTIPSQMSQQMKEMLLTDKLFRGLEGKNNLEVIEWLSKGYTMSWIASKMGYASVRTLENLIVRMKARLECDNITHLVATALRIGLIQ